MSGPEGVWVYAITAADPGSEPPELPGVGAEPLRFVTEDGLTAVVGDVDLADFGEEALRRHFEDLDWLAATARRHDAVVAAVCGTGATVPLRLATVYFDDERVRAMLREKAAALSEALTRVTGRTEWGVRVTMDRPTRAGPGADAAAAGTRPSGTDYLRRRKAQIAAREDTEASAAVRADEIYTELGTFAIASVRQPPTQSPLAAPHTWTILNATYLVDDRRAHEFAAAVEAIGARHDDVDAVLTGPWPPYSFTDVGDAGR